jgi:hypothetical protein
VPTLTVRRTYLGAIAVFVAAFVALYPYLGAMDTCDPGECPYATFTSETAAASLASACVSAVLSVLPAFFAFALFRGRRSPTPDSRPSQVYLSPDPPPPRALLGR